MAPWTLGCWQMVAEMTPHSIIRRVEGTASKVTTFGAQVKEAFKMARQPPRTPDAVK